MADSVGSGRKDAGMPKGGTAFLLAQIGAHAAQLFAGRVRTLGLTPAHSGMLRILTVSPGMTQKELAAALGTLPNRIVGLVDDLQGKGLVERRVQESDRRRHALHLTAAGQATMAALGIAARAHQTALLEALSGDEQAQLEALLQRVADQQGLMRLAHPGYARSARKSRSGP